MEIVIVPPVAASEARALATALERAGIRGPDDRGYHSAWRRSALREAVERSAPEDDYALSPRSTRGATRA
jgi:hypothetical protein